MCIIAQGGTRRKLLMTPYQDIRGRRGAKNSQSGVRESHTHRY